MAKNHKKPLGKKQIKKSRNGKEHINNCSTGYPATGGFYRNVHHIVCVACVSDATISKKLQDDDSTQFIKDCLHITKWNINAKENCISLPLKRAYAYKKAPSGWDGFPCHQVDHNPHYTGAVSEDLKKKIWNPSIKKGEKCEFDPKSLQSLLEKRSDWWRTFLESRGQGGDSNGVGTADSWKNRKKNPDTWYIPFSMHPDKPTRRKAPPDWDDFSASMKKYLKQIFLAI